MSITNCPQCKSDVTEKNQLLIQPCKMGHIVCSQCIDRKLQDSIVTRENTRERCWLLGKNCCSKLNHLKCDICKDTTFHILNDNLENIAKLQDDSHKQKVASLKGSSENQLEYIKSNCRQSQENFRNTNTNVLDQLAALELSNSCGKAEVALGVLLIPVTLGFSSLMVVEGRAKSTEATAFKVRLSEETIKSVKETARKIIELLQQLLDTAHECKIRQAILTLIDPGTGKIVVPPNSDIQDGVFRMSMVVTGVQKSDYIDVGFVGDLKEALKRVVEALESLIPFLEEIKNLIKHGKFMSNCRCNFSIEMENAIKELGKVENIRLKDLF